MTRSDLEARAYWYKVREARAVDGDTVRLVLDLGCGVFRREDVRLRGVDAPEVRGKSTGERAAAALATTRLGALLSSGDLWARTTRDGDDKFGRLLADLWVVAGDAAAENVAEVLLREGRVRSYNGGRRDPW